MITIYSWWGICSSCHSLSTLSLSPGSIFKECSIKSLTELSQFLTIVCTCCALLSLWLDSRRLPKRFLVKTDPLWTTNNLWISLFRHKLRRCAIVYFYVENRFGTGFNHRLLLTFLNSVVECLWQKIVYLTVAFGREFVFDYLFHAYEVLSLFYDFIDGVFRDLSSIK